MELDELVHQPTRLRIFAYLYHNGAATFPELREELDVTEGNLSSHAQTMEDADALSVEKEFVDRRPRTTYRLTEAGEELFEDHVATLETLIDGLEE